MATRTLDVVARRTASDLVAYQNTRYAKRFLDVIERISRHEADVAPKSTALTEAALVSLHKLMAYKDEYEVARLMLPPGWARADSRTA